MIIHFKADCVHVVHTAADTLTVQQMFLTFVSTAIHTQRKVKENRKIVHLYIYIYEDVGGRDGRPFKFYVLLSIYH